MMAAVRTFVRERSAWPWLAVMIAFVTVVSLSFLLGQSLRLDEAQSFFQTARTPSRLLELVAQDVHVPLYHLLLHVWSVAFGNGVATARILSLLFFAATIPVVYLIGKENFSRRIGLTAALLITISPFMNWYGSEARMYTLLTFMTVLNQLYFMRAWKKGGNSWIGYGVTAVLGMYSHYFFALVLVTQAIFYLTHRKSFQEGALKRLTAVAVAVGVALAPWLYFVFLQGSASSTKPQLAKPTSVDLFNTFSQFLFGFQTNYINTIIVSLWPILVLLSFLTLQRKKKMDSSAMYFAYAGIIPIVFAFLFSIGVRPLYLSRYLIVCLPALYLFIASVFSSYSTKFRLLLGAFLVLTMAGTLYVEIVSPLTPVKENYLGATRYLEKNAEPQDVVLVSAPFTIYPIDYYYVGRASVLTLPLWDRNKAGSAPAFNAQTLPGEVMKVTSDKQYAWLLLSYDQGYQKTIKGYFDGHYAMVDKQRFSDDLILYKYKVRYDPVVNLSAPATP